MTQEEIEKIASDYLNNRESELDMLEVFEVAKEVLEQKPKIGHWIRVDKNKVRCSACEVIHLIAQYPNGKIDWCPNCGAKMIKTQESEDKKCHKNNC